VIMYLLKKGFAEKYLCWFAHWETYASYKTMLKRIVGSTFSSSNIHEVVVIIVIVIKVWCWMQ
jgi:hypothetical protein